MGPYGSSVGNLNDYTNALMIGSGTGVVPMLSYLATYVRALIALDSVKFHSERVKARETRFKVEVHKYFR